MNLSSKQLRAFVALVDLRNFTRAAEVCHLSQPAFSALIHSLEEGIGIRLFDRCTRRVEMTPEGKLFEQSARRLLADLESAYVDLKDRVELRKGCVSIAVLPSVLAGALPHVLNYFKREHPGISIKLFDAPSDTCLDLLQRDRVDFALAGVSGDMAGLEASVLCADIFHVVCHRSHMLAAMKQIAPQDLEGHPFIHFTRNTSVRQTLDAMLPDTKFSGVMEVEQLTSVAALVSHGLGISIIPGFALFQFQLPELVVRPLSVAKPMRTVYLIRSAGKSLSIAASMLAGMLEAEFSAKKAA